MTSNRRCKQLSKANPFLSPGQPRLAVTSNEADVMRGPVKIALAFAALAAVALVGVALRDRLRPAGSRPAGSDTKYVPRRPGTVTFNKDIAPLVFNKCSGCHRPGQAAPFPLLNYEEVKKHARQIAEVTARRYMPPWLPEPGYGQFAGERTLSAEQIGLVQQWVVEGAAEGKDSKLPLLPKW